MIDGRREPKRAGIDAEPKSGQRQQQAEPGERHRKPRGQRDARRADAPVTAAPSTIGTSGSTQGDRIDSNPAAKASASAVT